MVGPTTRLLTMGVGLVVVGCSWKSSMSGGGTGGAGVAGATGTGGAVGAGGRSDAGPGTDGAPPGDAAAGDAATDAAPSYFTASYHMGADITWVQHDEYYGATYVDTDGVSKDILVLLKNHGFNSVRMRAYVDPMASDGYDQFGGFGDLAHTVTMAKRIKQAQMGFYLALHYSDNWADPGKQCIPLAWQGSATIEALATALHDYTVNVISALKAVGATPQLVQVGNEITSGMLMHICDANGIPTSTNPINGSVSNWANLGMLLKAGIAAVKEVDPSIKTVLHIEKARDVNASASFIASALAQNVPFEVFADSTYVYRQKGPLEVARRTVRLRNRSCRSMTHADSGP